MKEKFFRKSVIPLATLTGVLIPCIVPLKQASAIGSISRLTNSIFRPSSGVSSPISRVNSTSGVIGNNNGGSLIGRRPSNYSIGSQTSRLSSATPTLAERVGQIEATQLAEIARNKHPVNKAVAGLGILGSTVMVVGTVAGLIQQVGFMNQATHQQLEQQRVQNELDKLRDEFNRLEIPQAEQEIIDYYKNNYGIDITKNQ